MSENRRNNPDEMTVTERLESVKERICDKYCKYRVDKNITQDDLDNICNKCPLEEL